MSQGRKVTDPAIIERLNAMQKQRRVTDPNVIARLNAMQQQQSGEQQEDQNIPPYQKFLNSQPQQERSMESLEPFGGGGEPNRNATLNTAAFMIPQANVAKGAVGLGKIAQGLLNYGGHIAQSAGIGAGVNALEGEDIAHGAETGGLLGATIPVLGKVISTAAKLGKNTYNGAREIFKTAKETPVQHALPEVQEFSKLKLPEAGEIPTMADHVPQAPEEGAKLLQKLGKGAANKEEGAEKLSKIIMDKHAQRVEESSQFFKHPFRQAGKNKLYEHVDPLITTAVDKELAIMKNIKGLKVGPLYKAFKENPTIENAHWLQSELGAVVGDLKNNLNKTPADRATLASINKVRETLKSDIIDAFKRHDRNSNENLTPMYKKGIELHREHVEPFRSTPELREITNGGVETPKNIENIFDTPTNIKNSKGESKIGPINKVISDLPEEAKDLILFNKVGASKHSGNHQKLVDALMSAKNEGFSKYFNPHVDKSIESIMEKDARDIASKESIALRHKEAMQERSSQHAIAIAEEKAAHAARIRKAMLEHKRETQIIKDKNSAAIKRIEQAKKDKRKIIASSVLGGTAIVGLGGVGKTAHKLYTASNELSGQ